MPTVLMCHSYIIKTSHYYIVLVITHLYQNSNVGIGKVGIGHYKLVIFFQEMFHFRKHSYIVWASYY